jgi:hypothetical protein
MRRRDLLVVLVLGLVGCGNGPGTVPPPEETPQRRQDLAKTAGETAVIGYLAIGKPSIQDAQAIQVIVDKIRANLSGYREGGFTAALPGLEEAVDQLFPGEEGKGKRAAAKSLAKTLLEELDRLFEKHPGWKTKSEEVAGLIGAFLDGASAGFTTYLKE